MSGSQSVRMMANLMEDQIIDKPNDLAETCSEGTLAGATARSMAKTYHSVRKNTEAICAGLETEDHVVQPAPFISPPKWHLAHTTWFFDRFILQQDGGKNVSDLPGVNLLFNSYYKSQGQHWLQAHRGHLSRPPLKEVMAWRERVDAAIMEKLTTSSMTPQEHHILTIGIEHEKQHQELLLMDIKYILAQHPWHPALDSVSCSDEPGEPRPVRWLDFPSGPVEIGASGERFSYDNERPVHRQWLEAHALADRLVTNGEYLAFIEDNGYRRSELWLSDGWDWVQARGGSHPLYWYPCDGEWHEYHLGGLQSLDPALPVSHVSFYEADAFARWAGARLPTEFEVEHFLRYCESSDAANGLHQTGWQPGRSVCPLPELAPDPFGNGLLWQWTSSAYSPYPGFVPEDGALGEYNGKFMSNQYVLRGGCVATPATHLRPSYRNFYRTEDRWPFTGIRLARNAEK